MSQNYAPETAEESPVVERTAAAPSDARSPGDPISWRQCPRCSSDRVHRSHRRSWFERVLGLAVLPYRCEFCSLRFFRPRWLRVGH